MRRPLGALLLLLAAAVSGGASLPAGFTETSWSGITNPTAMAFAPDGRLFVCQQGGALRVIKNGALLATPFLTLTVDSNGERGLLGVAFDPNFLPNAVRLRLLHGADARRRTTASAASPPNGDVAGCRQRGHPSRAQQPDERHEPQRRRDPLRADGKLYVAVGENANSANSQIADEPARARSCASTADGTIPTDNPFFTTADAANNRAIWALGLRNPFTFAFQPGTGPDVHQRRRARTPGRRSTTESPAPTTAGRRAKGDCSNPSYVPDPFYTYNHITVGCAITGGDFYNPDVPQFPASYVGKYFFADYCGGWIKTIDPTSGSPTGDDVRDGDLEPGRRPRGLRREPVLPSPAASNTGLPGHVHRLERADDHAGPAEPARSPSATRRPSA